MSLSSQSIGYCTNKTNLQQNTQAKHKKPKDIHKKSLIMSEDVT